MGSANGLPHAPEVPEHMVEIPEFWMADAPVTAQRYEAVMGHNPSQFDRSPDLPVDSVNRAQAGEFCSLVSVSCGKLAACLLKPSGSMPAGPVYDSVSFWRVRCLTV
jgi:formylglycine-generating enzyme required for sulfatase activity